MYICFSKWLKYPWFYPFFNVSTNIDVSSIVSHTRNECPSRCFSIGWLCTPLITFNIQSLWMFNFWPFNLKKTSISFRSSYSRLRVSFFSLLSCYCFFILSTLSQLEKILVFYNHDLVLLSWWQPLYHFFSNIVSWLNHCFSTLEYLNRQNLM